MVTKPAKEFTDSMGRRRFKGNMDIEIAIDMLEMSSFLDHVVLFSGDGDFRPLVEAVQRRGVRVSVVSSLRTQPIMVSDDLRRQADNFIDLHDLSERNRPALPRSAAGGRDGRRRGRRAGPGLRSSRHEAMKAPGRDCPLCPRLAAFRDANRRREPRWHNAPVASFGAGDARLLVVGLAPGGCGAPTGRAAPFTGDGAGELLYAGLLAAGFARGR